MNLLSKAYKNKCIKILCNFKSMFFSVMYKLLHRCATYIIINLLYLAKLLSLKSWGDQKCN